VPPIAEIVDVGDLVNVVWTSLVAGIGVCIVFSLAIIGFARATDMRREGNGVATVVYLALALVAFVAVMALVVFGVIVMTSK
jgi:cation transporter-like permease